MEVHYFNTTQLTGEDLKEAVASAKDQEEAILLIYQTTGKPYTPSAILGMTTRAGRSWPLTSLRRAISNLTKKKDLVMLPNKREGLYGAPEHYWQVNKN